MIAASGLNALPNSAAASGTRKNADQHGNYTEALESRETLGMARRQQPVHHAAAVERRHRQHVEDGQHQVDDDAEGERRLPPFGQRRRKGRCHVEQQGREAGQQDVHPRPRERHQDHAAPGVAKPRWIDRHGLREAEDEGRADGDEHARQQDRAHRVHVLDRIERDPAEPFRRVVAELERRPAVRGLVERDGEQHRYHPDRYGEEPGLDHGGVTRASKASSSRRPSAWSKGSGECRDASMRSNRSRARPSSRRYGRRDILHFVAVSVAVKGQVAAGRERGGGPLADRPGQGPMERSSLTSKPSKPMAPLTASSITVLESVPGRSGSSAS